VVRAVVVAPGFAVVVMVRGFDAEGCEGEVVVVWVCWDDGEGDAFPCCRAECARKAARKLDRKGRCVGILRACLRHSLCLEVYFKVGVVVM
jgi:hypothetical protein